MNRKKAGTLAWLLGIFGLLGIAGILFNFLPFWYGVFLAVSCFGLLIITVACIYFYWK